MSFLFISESYACAPLFYTDIGTFRKSARGHIKISLGFEFQGSQTRSMHMPSEFLEASFITAFNSASCSFAVESLVIIPSCTLQPRSWRIRFLQIRTAAWVRCMQCTVQESNLQQSVLHKRDAIGATFVSRTHPWPSIKMSSINPKHVHYSVSRSIWMRYARSVTDIDMVCRSIFARPRSLRSLSFWRRTLPSNTVPHGHNQSIIRVCRG